MTLHLLMFNEVKNGGRCVSLVCGLFIYMSRQLYIVEWLI